MPRKLILLFTLIGLTCAAHGQDVAVNEILASNATDIEDEDGDREDWIELYNYGSVPADLTGFGLSDREDEPFRWVFPEVVMAPGEFLLVYASGKDRTDPGSELHTNFMISSSGEPILLTRPDGEPVDMLPETVHQTDVSYGRLPEADGAPVYFYTTTPGGPNLTEGSEELIAAPEFSSSGGHFDTTIAVHITHPHPDAEIIYTTDGSEPLADRLSGVTYSYKNSFPDGPFLTGSFTSALYEGPIEVQDRSNEPNVISAISSTNDVTPNYLPSSPVKKATVLKARAYVNGIGGPIKSATYFISGEGSFDYDIPIVSLSFDEDLLFGFEDGIYTAGQDFVTQTGGLICSRGNYNRRGRENEIFGHVSYLDNDTVRFNQGIGLRIQGNCSRQNAFKGTRMYARNAYDEENTFTYKFFDEDIPGAHAPGTSSFRRLSMRGPNYFDLAFSRLYSQVYESMGGRIQPVVQFLNGEFHGLAMLRDRFDTRHIATQFDLSHDNVVMVKIGYRHEIIGGPFNFSDRVFYLSSGEDEDMDDFWAMRDFIIDNDMADPEMYAQAEALTEMSSFIDHLILKIFAGDSHYAPEYVFWKTRVPENEHQGDGRWRVHVKDFDDACSSTDNYVEGIAEGTHPRSFGYEVFNSLLDNETFRHRFINRFADLLNSHFKKERFDEIILSAYDALSPYEDELAERWGNAQVSNPPRPVDEATRDALLARSDEHPDRQRDHIADYFSLTGETEVTVDVSDEAHGYVKLNTIDILPATPGIPESPFPWQGTYFENVPITFTAVPYPGFAFTGWELDAEGDSAVYTESYAGSEVSVKAVFEPLELYPEPFEAIHYWHFNALSGTVASVPSDLSLPPAEGTVTYEGFGSGTMDETDDGSAWNLGFGEGPGKALRVRNPSDDRHLLIEASTEGYENIGIRYAARRTPNGATMQYISYRTEDNEVFYLADSAEIGPEYSLYEFDFSGIPAVTDNPHFAVRIDFGGEAASGSSGNNRFDNISVGGTVVKLSDGTYDGDAGGALTVFPNPTGDLCTIRFTAPVSGRARTEIFNARGKLLHILFEGQVVENGTYETEYSTAKLRPGVYLIRVQTGALSQAVRLLKM